MNNLINYIKIHEREFGIDPSTIEMEGWLSVYYNKINNIAFKHPELFIFETKKSKI